MHQNTATACNRLESFEELQKLLDPGGRRLHSADPQMLLDAVNRACSVPPGDARRELIAVLRPELPSLQREAQERVLTTRSRCDASGESRNVAEYWHAMGELAYVKMLFDETGHPELEPILHKLAEKVVAARSRCDASGESTDLTEFAYTMTDHVAAKNVLFIAEQELRETECRAQRIIELRQNQTRAETCSRATAHTTGDRDTVRRARPRRGARPSGKGDGDADPEATARDIVSLIQAKAPLLVAPLTRLLATPPPALVAALTQLLAARSLDPWLDQAHWPFSPRVGMRSWREQKASDDDRVAVRGRVHYMRQSLIDEILRGSPQPKRARNMVAPAAHLSPLESLRREFDLAMAEAAE